MKNIVITVILLIILTTNGISEVPSDMRPFVQLWYSVQVDTYSKPTVVQGKIIRYGTLVNSQTRDMVIGSGTIITKSGLILTNYHVYNYKGETSYDDKRNLLYIVQPIVNSMTVYELADNDPLKEPVRKYRAEMMAFDSRLDLALLKINANADGSPLKQKAFSFVKIGNPFAMKINSILTIIGYPGKGGDTVTITDGKFLGYFKSKESGGMDGYIKTNAFMAPGNSGGSALFDGALIGVPTAVSLPGTAGSDFGYIHPITWAAGVLSLTAMKFDEKVPDIPNDWFKSDYNTDETRNKVFFAGFIEAAESKKPLPKAVVVIKRKDRTLDQIKALDEEVTGVKAVYMVQSLVRQGISVREIAAYYNIPELQVHKYVRTKIDEESLSPDVRSYMKGEFFYEVAETDSDGFYITRIPVDSTYDVAVIKDGYRVVEKSVRVKKNLQNKNDTIMVYKY